MLPNDIKVSIKNNIYPLFLLSLTRIFVTKKYIINMDNGSAIHGFALKGKSGYINLDVKENITPIVKIIINSFINSKSFKSKFLKNHHKKKHALA